MNCFENIEIVEKFLKRHKNYDGRVALILRSYLKKNAKVLNIGLNDGKDYEVLDTWYDTVAIESSQHLIDIYKKKNKNALISNCDDVKLDLDKKFDCIFTNKFLNRMTLLELKESLVNQANLLEEGGKVFHFFCDGEGELLLGGVMLNLFTEADLKEIMPETFEIVKVSKYLLDSRFSYMILKKK